MNLPTNCPKCEHLASSERFICAHLDGSLRRSEVPRDRVGRTLVPSLPVSHLTRTISSTRRCTPVGAATLGRPDSH